MTAGPYSIGSDHWPGLSKLVEEMGELQQVLGKLIATNGDTTHWDGTDLRERLVDEMGDVLAAVAFFAEFNGLPEDDIAARANQKVDLFEAWHAAQRDPS